LLSLFLTGFLLSLSLCLDLGVVNVALLQTGLRHGARPAMMLGLGSCFGDLTYALISVVAISFLLESSAVRWLLWIGGTLVLLWLTVKMFREATSREMDWHDELASPRLNGWRNFARGYALAVASPTAIVWFASVGGSLIASSAGKGAALLPFFSGFFSCGVVWSLALALLSGKGRRFMGTRMLRGFCFASAGLFLYFAVRVFWDGYKWVSG